MTELTLHTFKLQHSLHIQNILINIIIECFELQTKSRILFNL